MRLRLLILFVCSLSLLVGVVPGARGEELRDEKWGPFRGRMLDVDTGQPVPGAVALAIWLQNVPYPIHGGHRYYDARVAVTGTDGLFEIPRRPPPFFGAGIDTPLIEYFAPGYALAQPWTVADGLTIVRLRKWGALTPEQRRMHNISGRVGVFIPDEKIAGLVENVNVERRRIGLRPIGMLSGGPQ